MRSRAAVALADCADAIASACQRRHVGSALPTNKRPPIDAAPTITMRRSRADSEVGIAFTVSPPAQGETAQSRDRAGYHPGSRGLPAQRSPATRFQARVLWHPPPPPPAVLSRRGFRPRRCLPATPAVNFSRASRESVGPAGAWRGGVTA